MENYDIIQIINPQYKIILKLDQLITQLLSMARMKIEIYFPVFIFVNNKIFLNYNYLILKCLYYQGFKVDLITFRN